MATFISLSYPNLHQDPNVTTQSLLVQISQQLSNTTAGDPSSTAGPSVQSDFVPPISVVFINTVWFLSLVLSLSCALMATLLQQWARGYLQIVQRKYKPIHGARVHEYFSQGARKIGIFALVKLLPLFLFYSLFLFFAGLVVFAFRGNLIVAYFTLAIVGFSTLSYITLSLMSLIIDDCPFQTPLTPALRLSVLMVQFIITSVLHRVAKQLYQRWGTGSERTLKLFHDRHESMAKSFSENVISKLENSTEPLSIDMYKNLLVRTLHWLNEDHELEEFVAGIPGLYESEAVAAHDNGDTRRTIHHVLAVLPGPTSFHAPLPWCIIKLSQRAIASNLLSTIKNRRIMTCLKSLYYIPGAIHDVLASYAAGKHHCLKILPLLNSPESLEIINELWETPNYDVALSVRCVAAVVAAFMITPPRLTLDTSQTPNFRFIGDDKTGMQFLARRLRVEADADGGIAPNYQLRGYSLQLQNITRFLADIKVTLSYLKAQQWTNNAASIRWERRVLFDARHMPEFCSGRSTFDQHGNRSSPAFMPAAQQDLITLTLEILARDSIAAPVTAQREASRDASHQPGQAGMAQARELTRGLTHLLQDQRAVPGARALAQALVLAQVADSIEMVRGALEPVLLSLQRRLAETPAPHDDSSPSQIRELQTGATETASTTDTPSPAYVGSTHRLFSSPIEEAPSTFQYPPSSSRAGQEAATGELGYSISSDAPV